MNWELVVDPAVKKQLRRIPKRDADRLSGIIQELPANPYAGDIEKMEGEKDVWRRRVGAYRIFYEILTAQRVIYIYDVKRRTSNTY